MLPSERIIKAALGATHLGLVFIRNATLERGVDQKCINDVAEALHEIPVMLLQCANYQRGEDQLLELLRVHLACFDHTRWPGSPTLTAIFEDELLRP